MLKYLQDLIHRQENSQTPFRNIILTFIGVICLRSYLEPFSTRSQIPLADFIHFSLSYICLAMSLILLFYFATREAIDKIARVILPCFTILCLVPIADFLISFGKGYGVYYFWPGISDHMFRKFLFFLGPFDGHAGYTPGQRIEIALVVLMSCIYFYLKTTKILRSVLYAFFIYVNIFIYFAMPFCITIIFNALGLSFYIGNEVIISFYLLLILPLSMGLFYLYNKKYFFEIWKDSRPLRIVHFQLMVILGLVFTFNSNVKELQLNFFWVLISPAIIFAWLFSVMVNNIEDYEIDRISNSARPTVLKTIPSDHYINISWIFFLLALIYAAAVGFICCFYIMLFMFNYFLYSSPPFRLKRIPFFSKLVISLNSLLLFQLGYSLLAGDMIVAVPKIIVFYFLVCFTAAINFIDIKDYLGDKKAGIKTLPTLLGLEKSKLLIGSFFLISYSLTYFLLKDSTLLVVMITTGLIIFYLINRKDYSEKPVFIMYLFSIIFLIVKLFIRYWFNMQ